MVLYCGIQQRSSLFLICTLAISWFCSAAASLSQHLTMPSSLCGKRVREIDGAVVHSQFNSLYANSACVVMFRTDNSAWSRSRFLLQFEEWDVADCSVSLKVYNGDSSSLGPSRVLGCNDNDPPPFISRSRFLTLRLDKLRNSGYEFKLTLTAFNTAGSCSGRFWKCPPMGEGERYTCVDLDLRCDGVRNCLGSVDEANCTALLGRDSNMSGTGWLGMKTVIAIIFIIVISCIVGVVVAVVCCRRRHARHEGVIYQPAPPHAEPGAPPYSGYLPGNPPIYSPGAYQPPVITYGNPSYPDYPQYTAQSPIVYPPPGASPYPYGYPQPPSGYQPPCVAAYTVQTGEVRVQ